MPLYLDGYKGGEQTHSWDASLFFLDAEKTKEATIRNGYITLVSASTLPPVGVKLTYKQAKDRGFMDWLGNESPKLDYYILQEYGDDK